MNLNQHVFVTEYLRHRDKILAYAIAYNLESTRNATVIESAANRLLHNPEIAAEIRKTYDAVRHDVEQEIAREMRTELLTLQRKREILARIATGDLYVEQHYKGKNCSQCSQYIKPTINQMLKAIDMDSKLAGHYPTQTHQRVTPQMPVDTMPHNTAPALENTSTALLVENNTDGTGEETTPVIAEAGLKALLSPSVNVGDKTMTGSPCNATTPFLFSTGEKNIKTANPQQNTTSSPPLS